jgi:hypothetical protein
LAICFGNDKLWLHDAAVYENVLVDHKQGKGNEQKHRQHHNDDLTPSVAFIGFPQGIGFIVHGSILLSLIW